MHLNFSTITLSFLMFTSIEHAYIKLDKLHIGLPSKSAMAKHLFSFNFGTQGQLAAEIKLILYVHPLNLLQIFSHFHYQNIHGY